MAESGYEHKPAAYFTTMRSDVARHVPHGSGDVLELGCGQGGLGRHLREQGIARRVFGVEIAAEPAAIAREHLDDVLVGDVEAMELPFAEGQFDAIVAADVLEHLRDPQRVMARLHGLLAPGGVIVVALPNVRNWRVVLPLVLLGRFDYREEGILDETHLRFFTRRSMIQLCERAGFTVRHVEPTGQRSRALFRLPLGPLLEFIVPQYILVCTKDGAA